jgi:hypothetical protein
MKINDLPVRVYRVEPNIEINYELQIASSGYIYSIDRGAETDLYECRFTFRGTRATIDGIMDELQTARIAKTPIVLTECEEKFFGENVDHTAISCVVSEFGTADVYSLNSFEFSATFRATALTFTGSPSLPSRLQCEQISSSSGADWGATVNSTYYVDNYHGDHRNENPRFTGRYIFTNDQLRDFMAFRRSVRGTAFTITDAQWGVDNMFGIEYAEASHDVVLESATYERISPVATMVTITLIRAIT